MPGRPIPSASLTQKLRIVCRRPLSAQGRYRNQSELKAPYCLPSPAWVGRHGRPTKYKENHVSCKRTPIRREEPVSPGFRSARDHGERRLPPNHFSWNAPMMRHPDVDVPVVLARACSGRRMRESEINGLAGFIQRSLFRECHGHKLFIPRLVPIGLQICADPKSHGGMA
jgi:hypothetical protein